MSFQTKIFSLLLHKPVGRTTIRSQPLYALTIEDFCEGSGYLPPPDPVQPGSYTPKSPPCHEFPPPSVKVSDLSYPWNEKTPVGTSGEILLGDFAAGPSGVRPEEIT